MKKTNIFLGLAVFIKGSSVEYRASIFRSELEIMLFLHTISWRFNGEIVSFFNVVVNVFTFRL